MICFYDELYDVSKRIEAVRWVFESEQHRLGRGKLVSTVTLPFPCHSFRDYAAKILILLVVFIEQSSFFLK